MRKNEYNNIEEFISQYTGEWNPSENHWMGLDFSYKNVEYRLHTGSMFNEENTVFENGKTALFGLYKKINNSYILIKEYSNMTELLASSVIDNTPFRCIIMDDDTELLGQD